MPEVDKIYKKKTHTLENPEMSNEIEPTANGVEWNVEKVKADQAWDLGYDGTGVVVANIDSGVDWTHPHLRINGEAMTQLQELQALMETGLTLYTTQALPADSDDHGTHVMGTMVGQESDGSNKIGMAPGAKWIAARVFNTAGSTTDAILLSAAQWMLAPGGNQIMPRCG